MAHSQAVLSPHLLSALKRSDLETSYQGLHQENIHLRKTLHQQINETNRLRSLLFELLSLVKYRKVPTPAVVSEKDNTLQLYIDLLNEKVVVLTQQLLDHSRFHSEVHKCYRGINWPQNVPNPMISLINRQCNEAIQELILKEEKKGTFNESIMLQELERASEAQEKENTGEIDYKLDPPTEVDKLLNNLDIIRLRRLIKRQAIQNATLSFHVDAADKEAYELRKALDQLQIEFEELSREMVEEKQKNEAFQLLNIELSFLRHHNKMLTEEIRDIQEEKKTLKLTNKKLLNELDAVRVNGQTQD